MKSIHHFHRQVVDCNSDAKVRSSIQRTAVKQSHLILSGRVSTFMTPKFHGSQNSSCDVLSFTDPE